MTKTTDWQMRFDEEYTCDNSAGCHYVDCCEQVVRGVESERIKDFIRKEIESARREVIDEISKKSFEDDNGCYGKIIRMDDVLSALRKEEV